MPQYKSELSPESISKQGGIYIHIPFCVQKCIYCDFFSDTDLSLIPQYVKAVESEIKNRAEPLVEISTVYFGGGTPSLLSVKDADLVLTAVQKSFTLLPDAEISFEVNPGTVNLTYLKELRKAGINRLSIGVQSFEESKLKFLRRIHTSSQAVKAVNDAEKAGFSHMSLDLIYGLPFETESMWLQDIENAVATNPDHLSCYMLAIEPSTPLDRYVSSGIVSPCDKDFILMLFRKTVPVLNDNQFEHYEISNFARGRAGRSRHNSQYWDRTSYYGFGASAHSYDGGSRSWNHSNIADFIKDIKSGRLPVQEVEILDTRQNKLETIMLRLRTLEGIDLAGYRAEFDVEFEEEFKAIIPNLQKHSFASLDHGFFSLTLEGKTCLDHIVETFAQKI